MREYLVQGFEILTGILCVVLFISAFLFTSKGLISRKTLIVSFACFVLFMASLWITAALTNPSTAMLTLICLTGVVILGGIVFAVKYYTLPSYRRYIEKKTHEVNDD